MGVIRSSEEKLRALQLELEKSRSAASAVSASKEGTDDTLELSMTPRGAVESNEAEVAAEKLRGAIAGAVAALEVLEGGARKQEAEDCVDSAVLQRSRVITRSRSEGPLVGILCKDPRRQARGSSRSEKRRVSFGKSSKLEFEAENCSQELKTQPTDECDLEPEPEFALPERESQQQQQEQQLRQHTEPQSQQLLKPTCLGGDVVQTGSRDVGDRSKRMPAWHSERSRIAARCTSEHIEPRSSSQGSNGRRTCHSLRRTGVLEADSLTGLIATSRLVAITNHGLTARYIGTKSQGEYKLQGVVVGNGPLREHQEYGRYFAVKVRHVFGAIDGDGLAIGVTTSRPHDIIRHSPTELIEFRTVWAFGFDQLFWDGPNGMFVDIKWRSSTLRVGDVVGMLIEPTGCVVIFVNDVVVHIWEGSLPVRVELYPIMDLLGTSNEVDLLFNARPPPPPE